MDDQLAKQLSLTLQQRQCFLVSFFLFLSFLFLFLFVSFVLKVFFSSVEKKVCYKSDKKRFLQISKELQHPLRGKRHFNFVKRKLFHPKCFIIWYESHYFEASIIKITLHCVWLTWETSVFSTKHLNFFSTSEFA